MASTVAPVKTESREAALSLILDLSRSPHTQDRRNALTALMTVGSLDAVRAVVRIALTDPDARVRERARQELLSGARQGGATVESALNEMMDSSDPRSFYELAGALHSEGLALAIRPRPFIQSLRLGWQLRRQRKSDLPGLKTAFVGTSAGLIFLMLWAYLAGINFPHNGGIVLLALISWTFPFPFVLLTRKFWYPIQKNRNWINAYVLDMAPMVLTGALILIILEIVTLLAAVSNKNWGLAGNSAIAGALVAGLAASRLFGLVWHGCCASKLANRIVETIAGGFAGLCATTLLLWLLRERTDHFSSIVWPLVPPILGAVVFTFVRADADGWAGKTSRPVFGPWIRRLTFWAALASVCFFTYQRTAASPSRLDFRETRAFEVNLALGSLPAAVPIQIPAARLVRFSMPAMVGGTGMYLMRGPHASRFDLHITPLGESPMSGSSPPATEFKEYLLPGTYHLVVGSDNESMNLADWLDQLMPALIHPIRCSPQDCHIGVFAGAVDAGLPEFSVPASGGTISAELLDRAKSALDEGDRGTTVYGSVLASTRALQIWPEYAEAFLARGTALNQLGLYRQSVDDLSRSIKLPQTNRSESAAFIFRGQSLVALHECAQAIADFTRAIAAFPKSVVSYSGRGLCYDDLGHPAEAIADFDQAIAKAGENVFSLPLPHNYRGYVYNELGEYERAIMDFNAALKVNPYLARARKNRGRSYFQLGRYHEAMLDLNAAIAIDPELTQAFEFRADLKEKLNDPAGAAADRVQAEKLRLLPAQSRW